MGGRACKGAMDHCPIRLACQEAPLTPLPCTPFAQAVADLLARSRTGGQPEEEEQGARRLALSAATLALNLLASAAQPAPAPTTGAPE